MATYKRICAWCNPPRVMEEIEVSDDDPMVGKETHGICAEYAAKQKKEMYDRQTNDRR